jgi:hypothetical protein
MAIEVEKVRAVPLETSKGPRITFQSSSAAEGARVVPREEEEPKSALVGGTDERIVAVPLVDMDTSCVVCPRQTIPRTRIGNAWYSFQANKKCSVPRHVMMVLEEKGIV